MKRVMGAPDMATTDKLADAPITHDEAAEAVSSMDDFAKMDTSVDPFGPRATLERYIAQQRAASIAAPPAQGEWVMVPRVPTEAMRDAGNDGAAPYMVDAAKLWAQMLAASPQPAPAPVQVDGKLAWALEQGGVLADWCNTAGDALRELMRAYERRVRSSCTDEKDLDAKPWRCAEYVQAENAIATKPVPVFSAAVPRADIYDLAKQCGAEFDCGEPADRQTPGAPPTYTFTGRQLEQFSAAVCAQPPAPAEVELPPLPELPTIRDRQSIENYATAYARAAIAALAQQRREHQTPGCQGAQRAQAVSQMTNDWMIERFDAARAILAERGEKGVQS